MCIGQKQVWFLLQFTGEERDLQLDLTDSPEFDHWRWVDFWYPLEHVVSFKRGVYSRALRHLAPTAREVAGTVAIPQPAPDMVEIRRGIAAGDRIVTTATFLIDAESNLNAALAALAEPEVGQ